MKSFGRQGEMIMANESEQDTTSARKLIFSKKDWHILQSLQRQVKKRYVTRALLVIGLLYCLGMCGLSTYYAVLMFMGAEDHVQVVMPEVKIKKVSIPAKVTDKSQSDEISAPPQATNHGLGGLLPSNMPTVETTLALVKPIYERINFFNIGWTSALHAALLFYLATRAFLRLRLLKKQTPRAKLALKMADRLRELGELEEENQNEPSE